MIIVREVFRLKFGQAKETKVLVHDGVGSATRFEQLVGSGYREIFTAPRG